MTASFTPKELTTVTWERFTSMFRDKYVPPVDRERLAQEFFVGLMSKSITIIGKT